MINEFDVDRDLTENQIYELQAEISKAVRKYCEEISFPVSNVSIFDLPDRNSNSQQFKLELNIFKSYGKYYTTEDIYVDIDMTMQDDFINVHKQLEDIVPKYMQEHYPNMYAVITTDFLGDTVLGYPYMYVPESSKLNL